MTPRSSRRLLVVMAATLAALMAVEAGLRNVGGVFHDRFTVPDAQRGWGLRPGFSGWVADENTLWVSINRDGLRDRERALEPRAGILRVAMLGDSYVQGVNVPADQTLPALLEDRLAPCLAGSSQVPEVINFGVSGYGTAQELLTFRHHAAKYRPHVVMLAVYTGNDIFNNHRALNPTDYAEQSPYFTLNGDQLELDTSFRAELESPAQHPWWRRLRIWVADRLRVAQLLYETWGWVRPFLVAPAQEQGPGDPALDNLSDEIYRPPTIPAVDEAWRVTEALLLTLAREVHAAGAEFWIVTLANRVQIDPRDSERQALKTALGVENLYYPDRRIRAFAELHGIPVITLAERMADLTASTGGYLNGGYNARYPLGSGHWNDTGNRIAAGLISESFCASRHSLARR
jgi:hypothetical protein